MRQYFCILIILFVGSAAAEESLLVENITVLSSNNGASHPIRNVLIRDGRIEQISSERIIVEDNVQTINGLGKFMTPGIMDSHIHVSIIPGLGFAGDVKAAIYPEIAHAYFAQQPRSLLYYGVTQILDPNPGTAWGKFESTPRHPDYFRCEVITAQGLFPAVELPPSVAHKIYPYFVIEPSPETDSINRKSLLEHSPEAVVERIAESGARCIKLYFENGYGDASQWPLLSDKTVTRIGSAAKLHGLSILAHANAVDMYEEALKNDVDVIAHGLWNWGDDNAAPGLPDSVKTVLDEIHKRSIGFMPTCRIIAGLGELMFPQILENPEYTKVTPRRLLAWYKNPEAQWFKNEVIVDFGDLQPKKIAEIFEYGTSNRGRRSLQYLNQLGHPLLLGSDSPGSPSYANQPGLNTYKEMKMMALAGISLKKIFAAATINNVVQFGLDDDYGTVEEGKIANLLILKENPLDDIEAWDSIESIVLHGRVIARDTLAAKN